MPMSPGLPPKQGLYDPANEKDACGVGFVANIKGRKSHAIIARGVDILCKLTHRGAVGADPLDGDGAGIQIQIPDAFYREVVDFPLPMAGDYGTGLMFLPKDEAARSACVDAVENAIKLCGLKLLGWRAVPVSNRGIGRNALGVEPTVQQVFIGLGEVPRDRLALMLYLARKRAENAVRDGGLNGDDYFYVCSLSNRTVLYKGMLLSEQLPTYFPDLSDQRAVSAIAFVHQRYSTNTFPSWDLAQPFRFVAHNGEINTLRGNVNRMRAREALFNHPILGDSVEDLKPVILDEDGSDTACFDNALELLVMCGYPLEQALAMMVPEAWLTKVKHMPRDIRGFFEYHATMMEPWDGPANIVACDGKKVVAILDRNGLRPARYWITDEDEVIYASEAGVVDVDPSRIVRKDRLAPGKMIMIDTQRGEFIEDREIKQNLAKAHRYADWIEQYKITLDDLPAPAVPPMRSHKELRQQQQAFGYTVEDMRVIMAPMCIDGQEPVGSMGTDTPHAVLSNQPKLLYWYFKQLFAQVTNPAVDPIREEIVMSLRQYIGAAKNILTPLPTHCRMLEIDHPILRNEQLEQIKNAAIEGFSGTTISTRFDPHGGTDKLEWRLGEIFAEAEAAIEQGHNVLILSDRGVDADNAPIPALLAVGAIHHHLIRVGKRTQCSLVVETGEPREVHHFALLLGYGATAINPYLAFSTIQDMVDEGMLESLDGNRHADDEFDALHHYTQNYIKAIGKGLFKIFSKMGISTLQSYAGAQIFEAIGLEQSVIDRFFAGTVSRIEGIGLAEIHRDTHRRHRVAYAPRIDANRDLDRGGEYSWRRDGEFHLMHPEVVATLQHAIRAGDYHLFKRYTAMVDRQSEHLATLRGLFRFKHGAKAIALDEVESRESIFRRFVTGAMSLGSISPEAHETLAIAMNRIGGRSNTGEGGEDPRRFVLDKHGDLRRSAIKQVASGRFGVTPHYLVNADELQIKVAQGAKPGEGGQLPGHKVSPYIAWLRFSVPGVTLISPPPHHDIYSIEDLAQLIYDLKNCNPAADVSVKLVSESGVGTVAAGVAKGHADAIVIAGFDGGTGASPMSSIKHAGMPWEIGLAETQQTLVLNDLRGRVRLQTDGQMRTGRDVVIAAMLGAEDYAFGTLALVLMGCIMMRKCHLNTCPVGIATQNEALRRKFDGQAEHVINYFTFLADEVREILAELGVRSLDELIGRSDLLEMDHAIDHYKAKGLDFSKVLARPAVGPEIATRKVQPQDHNIDTVLDRELIAEAAPALERGERVSISRPIRNHNRTVGTMLSGEVAKHHGRDGLPPGTISLSFKGVAGQSFCTFLAPGIQVELEGEANDYVGKGMAGGRIVIRPDATASFDWSENSIVGNTVLYGATGGEVYFAGRAGERFCVRNSGVHAVVEGVGDHGCEYMTGGVMVCLGPTGRNFAAGMSGGLAYVLDEARDFGRRINHGMVDLEQIVDEHDIAQLKALVERHAELTGSPKAQRLLADWETYLPQFVKVFPHEYRRALMEGVEPRPEPRPEWDETPGEGKTQQEELVHG